MALCMECSPAVQEVPGSIPRWDATFSDALCKGCRWLWSSLYIVMTPTWSAILMQRHAFGRISTHTLHATESHSATIPHLALGGSCSSTSWDPEWILIRRSNGSLHRVFTYGAGGPEFDSPLRRNILRCSMQRMSSLYITNFEILPVTRSKDPATANFDTENTYRMPPVIL